MQEKQNKTGLVWFRNDLRVHDNVVLEKAIKNNTNVLAVYCFDPRHYEATSYGFKKTEKFRAQFLIESITDLKANLSKLNINLLTYHNTPESIIPELVETYAVTTIYFQKEWTSEEVSVVESLKSELSDHVNLKDTYDQFLFHPEDLNMAFSDIPKVFTNFRKYLEKSVEIRKAIELPEPLKNNLSTTDTPIVTLADLGFEEFTVHPHTAFPFEGGETSGMQRLEDYIFKSKKIGVYKKTRNGLIGTDFSSKFSAWLANGSISARTIYWEIKRFEDENYSNDSTYWLIFELIWRDFFKYISLKHGSDIFKIEGILDKDYDWNTHEKAISQWIHGNTSEPFVNANMIEIAKTGWMSNRGRQNVASYFAKELEIDWRIGAAYFESLLVDYDVHSNYGNWMYVSGVGNDPRDRKFNIKSQAERYDPNNTYQNLWLQKTIFE